MGGGGASFAPVMEPPMPDVVPPPVQPQIQDMQLAEMLQRAQEHQATLPPSPQQGIPVNQGKGTPTDPLKFLDNDPRVTQRFDGERGAFQRPPGDVILHDRAGSTPADGPRYGVPRTGDTFPYHVEVQPDGSIKQFHQGTSVAPHASAMSPNSLGIAYGGQYGAQPTPQAMRSLQDIYSRLRDANPDLQFRSHGQAYADTKGGDYQASVSGRDLREASWRDQLNNVPPMAPPNGPMEQFAFQPQPKLPWEGRPGSQSVTGVSSNSVTPPQATMMARAPAPPIGDRGIMGPAIANLRNGLSPPGLPPQQVAQLPPPSSAPNLSPNDNSAAAMAPGAPMRMADAGDPLRGQTAPGQGPVTGLGVANAMNGDYSGGPSRLASFAPKLPLEYQNPGATRFAQPNLPGTTPPTAVADASRLAQPALPANGSLSQTADAGRFAAPGMANSASALNRTDTPPTLAAALQQENGGGVVNPGVNPQAAPAAPGTTAQTMPSQTPADGPRRLADANDPLRREKAPMGLSDMLQNPNKSLQAFGKAMQGIGGKYAAVSSGGMQMADIAPQTPARQPTHSQGSGRMRRFKSAFPVEPTQT